MKTIALILLGLGIGLTGYGQHKPKKAEPIVLQPEKPKKEKKKKKNLVVVEFDKYVIERNDIVNGSQQSFVFTFKNNGKVPVMITEVRTSCGCTTASKPDEPVNPGKKSEIVVSYDTKRTGPFTKEITIMTNVQPEPIILMIKGSVKPPEVGTDPGTEGGVH